VRGPSPEVEIAIAKLKKCKLPGSDQIPAELIQAGGETLLQFTKSLILFGLRRMPDQWKEPIVLPIYKKGDKTDCATMSLSLLSSYKILSNTILSRLNPYIYEVTGDHQCGFRHNRSTTDQIFCIHQILE
jgi:hypothetical protein